MRLPSWGEVETKIRTDLDLLDQANFIGQDEMATLGNDAISAAESLIMRAREDYFLTTATITLVNGQANYALPTNIFGQKIRELTYVNGSRIFPLTRLKDPLMFYQKEILDFQATSFEEYRWFLKSTTAGAQDELFLTPAALEAGPYLVMWYIRNANRIQLQAAPESVSRATQIATVLDIPEWRSFVEQHVKVSCYEKMKDPEGYNKATAKLAVLADAMVVSLKDRAEDNENEVAQDISHYVEHN